MELKIEGMTCGSCISLIQDALEENKDIESAEVSIGLAKVKTSLPKEQVAEIIKKAGFKVLR